MNEKRIQPPGHDVEIIVDPDGYLFGREILELVRFIPDKKYARAADLGTGDGIIAILAARERRIREIWAVDLHSDACDRARRSTQNNALDGVIRVVNADIRKLQGIVQRASFDLVTANPPFLEVGRDFHSRTGDQAAARTELAGGLPVFLQTARFLLKKGGDLVMVYQPRRLEHLFLELNRSGFTPKEMQFLHHTDGRSLFVLMRAVPGGKTGLTVLPAATLPESFKGRK